MNVLHQLVRHPVETQIKRFPSGTGFRWSAELVCELPQKLQISSVIFMLLFHDADWCASSIAIASPKHWDIWLRYVKLRAEGHEPAPGSITPERFWHPEVLRRRANAEKGGLAHMDATQVAAFLGFDDVDVESEVFDVDEG